MLLRVEHHKINDPPKAPEKENWLLKCKIINQKKEENKHKESRRRKLWSGVWRTENLWQAAGYSEE